MTNYEVCYLICTMSICVKYLSRMTSQEMEIWCQEVSEEILVNFMIDIYKNTSYLIENEHVNMYRNMKICDGLYMTNLGMKQVLLQNKCFIAIATFFVSYGFFFFFSCIIDIIACPRACVKSCYELWCFHQQMLILFCMRLVFQLRLTCSHIKKRGTFCNFPSWVSFWNKFFSATLRRACFLNEFNMDIGHIHCQVPCDL